MKPCTVVITYSQEPYFKKTLLSFTKTGLFESIVIVTQGSDHIKMTGCRILVSGPLSTGETLNRVLGEIKTEYLLLLPGSRQVSIEPRTLERFLQKAESSKAAMVYSDFYDENEHGKTLHPLNDYQLGSVRDDFDFGAMVFFSVPSLREALKKYGPIPGVRFAGLYDFRLKVSIDHSIHHLQEPLYSLIRTDEPVGSERLFAYVDPRNETVQKEMETVFTDYLKKIGAYLPSHRLRVTEPSPDSFPVEVSVIIPVRNRKETIAEAVKSALSQETDFPFNVIVVDNHSTDGTTDLLSDLARQNPALNHIVPGRTGLGIGGCWNEALRSEVCGRFAAQLDSDDLYSSDRALQKIVSRLRQGDYAMVIGSYTLVDSRLEEIPPGLIAHREWTDQNGHNNALRVNGLGAPRAFDASLMREFRFLNVSYGEDYAAALRICREYRIGRIYESLYLCRRWSGNTDAALSIVETNRNDVFKDSIRTEEILARQQMAKSIARTFQPNHGQGEDAGGGKG